VNNGHSIQVDYDPGSTLEIGGVAYPLAQFHFHALSEHMLNGRMLRWRCIWCTRTAAATRRLLESCSWRARTTGYELILTHMPAEEGNP